MRHLFHDNLHLLVLAIVVLAVGGAAALVDLPRLEDPRITNRNPLILVPAPGMTAERIEAEIAEPIETALDEIPEIKVVESTARAGIAVIAVELEDAVTSGENERIFSKMRDRIGDVADLLPPEASPPVLDDQRDPVAFTLVVALRWLDASTSPAMGLLTREAEDFADALRAIPGTDLVRIYGGVEEEIEVVIDRDRAASLGLDAGRIAARLTTADARASAGVLRTERHDLPVRVEGEFDETDRIASVPVAESSDGRSLPLDAVASVTRRWREPVTETGISDGRRCVYVAARMGSDVQAATWARRARSIVADRSDAIAGGRVDHAVVFDQTEYTERRLRELVGNLLLGAGVVALVVWLVMGWRAGLVVGSALPLVMAAVLLVMAGSGGAIHQMSIFGMIIALGLLIDNAIVVTDEIGRRADAGRPPRQAVGEAIGHLAAPLFASTFTTMLAFAPIVLLPGNAGDFVGSIGTSVILAIAASYLISLTIIAGLAGRFVAPHRGVDLNERHRWWRDGIGGRRLAGGYSAALRTAYRAPLAALVIAAAPAALGFAIAPQLGQQFFPPVDRDMFHLRVWLPASTPVERTREVAERMESIIRAEHPEIERIHWLAGGSFPRVYYNLLMNQDRASHHAQAVLDAVSAEATDRLVPALQASLDPLFPEAQVVVRSFGQGPPVDADVEFRITGENPRVLQDLGDEVRRVLAAHPDVLHVRTSMPRGEPELHFVPDDETEARLAGFGLGALAADLRGHLDGAVGGAMLEDLVTLPVRVRIADAARADLDELASRTVGLGAGRWMPLDALGGFRLEPEIGGITRRDAIRVNEIGGYTREDSLPIEIVADARRELDAVGFDLPEGYALEVGGSAEQDAEARASLAVAAPVLVVLMLSTLVLTFRSVRIALILVGVGGLCVGIALLSTWSIGFPVSFNTILGTLGLIGVGLNDSIVVLAAIRDDPAASAGDVAALARRVRDCTRHVVATTFTTIGGFLPLLIFVGGDFWPSLAIVLAGGVSGATLLALLFVPAAYRLLHLSPARG